MLDFPVRYGALDLNTVEDVGDGKQRGCMLEEFDYARSQGVGYTEKRAQDDGLDVGDVYQGARYINLTGRLLGEDVADVYDRLQDLRTILTPTIAYASDVPNFGYIPLEFVMPTNRTDDFPDGFKLLEFRGRPMGQPQFTVRRDGGSEPGARADNGGVIMWRSTLECRDPRMYLRPYVDVRWNTAQTNAPLSNRGDYPAPLDILIILGAASTAASKVEIDVGKSNMTIGPLGVYPTGTVFRYSGTLKVMTVQAPGALTDVLAMDLFSFRNNTTHPAVPPGDSTYSTRLTSITLAVGTRFMYSESFA